MRCEKCGIDYNPQLDRCPSCGASAAHGGKTEFYGRAAYSKVGIIDFFNGMFAKHPKGTAVKLFMSGTSDTTPRADQMLAQWQKPWLFFRLLVIGFVFTLLCGIMIYMQQSAGYITLWSIGSLIIPLAILTFYWEINIPRDIPIYTVIGVFFLGGVISLVITIVLDQIINSEYGQFAWFAPAYEEPAKLLAAAIFIKKVNARYGFGGILLGGAVGAGFAAFENIKYVFSYYAQSVAAAAQGEAIDPTALPMEVFILRALLSFGGHAIWAAMYCGALVLEKGDGPLSINHFFKKRFLIYFGAAFGLHFLWNLLSSLGVWVNVILMVVGIAVLFSIIKTCLIQVVRTAEMARFNPNVPPVAFASGAQPQPIPPQVQQPAQNPYPAPQQNVMPQQSAVPQNYQQQNVTPQIYQQQNAAFPQMSAATAVAVSAQLVGVRGALQGRALDFSDQITIGRDPAQCNAVFPADTPGISRKHCSVRIEGNSLMITDHGSSSGTFLANGQRVPSGQWVTVNGVFYLGSQQNMFSVSVK